MLKKDLKKHLLRAKQLAEQNFGRADKSEVLPEDLELLDKRINHIKTACHNVGKKVLSVKDSGSDKEKRLRKVPEQQLAQQMIDSSTQLGTDTLMGGLFHQCGDTQSALARELVEYEVEVESRVLAPIHTMTEQEIPNIQRKKRQLEKLVLDYDTARSRYISSQEKHREQVGGAAKTEAAHAEMEEAHTRVEQCRDQLSTDMLSFHAKEAESSKFLIDLIRVQADYHEKALKVLQQAIPRMEEMCDHNKQLPAYGTSLEEHLERTNREIASVIEICIAILAEEALEEEGLFRIAGGSSKVKKVKAALDVGRVPDMEEIRDIHCIAGALKLYLRELPEPLLTYNLYNEWMQASHLSHDEKMQTLWIICGKLPKPNYNNLRYLIKFLGKLAEKSDINKMSPSNIAIVIGPNLLWPKDSGQNVLTTASQSSVAESLIAHSDYFFPGEIVFKPIEKKPAPILVEERKPQPSSPGGKYLSLGKRKSKSKERNSIGSALTTVSQTLTLPVSKAQASTSPQKPLQAQVIVENEQLTSRSKPLNSDDTSNLENVSEVDDRQSIDSGIGSSYSGSAQPSLKRKSSEAGTEPNRPTTIFEITDSSSCNISCSSPPPASSKSHQAGVISQGGSDSSLLQGHSSLVTEKSCKRAITPPPRPPPRSLHSDMYDTVFMLQTLKGGGAPSPEGDTSVSDYLTKVRTIWDDQYKSPSKRFSIGPTHAEIPSEEELVFDLAGDGGDGSGEARRDRTRASSEPRVLLEGGLLTEVDLIGFDGKSSGKNTIEEIGATGVTSVTTENEVRGCPSVQDQRGEIEETASSKASAIIRDQARPAEENPPEVPKRKKHQSKGDIDFGLSNDKSTPPGTLNRKPSTGQAVEKESSAGTNAAASNEAGHISHNQHQTLAKSSSGNNLIQESAVQDSPSPVQKRKVIKKAAPPPPTMNRNVDKSSSLERRNKPAALPEKPPVLVSSPTVTTPSGGGGDKPMVSPGDHRPPPIPDRPTLGPPPALPNKPLSPTTEGENQLGVAKSTGTGPPLSPGKPERPKPVDRPTVAPPDKPNLAAYDSKDSKTNNGAGSVGGTPYGVTPGGGDTNASSSSVSGVSKPTEGLSNVSSGAGVGSPVTTARSGSTGKTPGGKTLPPRPHPPPKHGSRGSDKDFQFVKDDLAAAGQLIARKRSTNKEEDSEATNPQPPSPVTRQESKNVETRL